MATDITATPLVHTVAGASDVIVERDHHYSPTAVTEATDQRPLEFDLYRPPHAAAPCPAIVFVTGLPDPGVKAMLGKPLKDWAAYQGWARMVAASGIAGILYENRGPQDVVALVRHLRTNAAALGIDPQRIGVWACSGHGPTALWLIAREPVACAALVYPYLLDLDGATAVADALAQFRFTMPAVTFDELPRELAILVVRAGRDALPGLDPALLRFVAAARARAMAVTLIEHADAPHAFDQVDDSPRTHAVIEEILAFLRTVLRPALG